MNSELKSRNQASSTNKLIAVAIDKDKGSQSAFKWAIENILGKGQIVVLLHVKIKPVSSLYSSPSLSLPRANQISDASDETSSLSSDSDMQAREFFLPFRCYCTRKNIQCHEVLLEDTDVAKALVEYVGRSVIDVLVLGAGPRPGLFRRFKAKDIPGSTTKGAPDFCTVYVVSKGKLSVARSASRPAPSSSPLRNLILRQASKGARPESQLPITINTKGAPRPTSELSLNTMHHETNSIKSPSNHRRGTNERSYGEFSPPGTDSSFVSSGKPSSSSGSIIDQMFPSFGDSYDVSSIPSRLSGCSDLDRNSFEMWSSGRGSTDCPAPLEPSYSSLESDILSTPQEMDDVEAEMRRLKLELKQTMDMYSTACKEALSAKQKATELQRWKMEEQQRLEEARLAEEAALAIVENEKAKSRAAIEHAQAAQRIAELESQKRINAEMKALKEAEEKNKALNALAKSDIRYRRYSIEEIEFATDYFSASRKIGEGGYGPVYKCYLDHTPVAVKVLRPDAVHGRSQFQQEVEVLSCIRHPNMVLLLGACPEYGCLVYEYMSCGSLEDCLFHQEKSRTLSWQHRFRIATEIGTGLLFLHQTKPEPLVHRDLKPANILLDGNYVSKIADVGLARLVPPSIADTVTQYRMTSTAGTFCYIDPEYQQTGMLGIKSDIYSLGIMFLQIITAKPPMGLTHLVESAIEQGTFDNVLDPAVQDWPMEETLNFAKLSLQCAELRRKDRPDLGKIIMPELESLRSFADGSLHHSCSGGPSPSCSQVSTSLDELSYPTDHSAYEN